VSLATRALAALALIAGFYALALGTVAGLLWLVWLDVQNGRIYVELLLVVGALSVLILWAIVPRRTRFEAPGPRLQRDEQPELFALVEEVARAARQSMPTEVYLAAEVNASVLQTGRRRVMTLGLPLMQVLTVPQFRAVIAHEFGHFDGGDTWLAPLVHRAHVAIERAVEALDDGILNKPFAWYGALFLRGTRAVSRAQEIAADALAARIAGARQMADALLAIASASASHEVYWSRVVLPLLEHGYRPPLAAGFAHFVVTSEVEMVVAEGSDPLDSHPPLHERLSVLGHASAGQSEDAAPRAISLLRDLPRLEAELIPGDAVSWEDAGPIVYLPHWQEKRARHAAALREVTALGLPKIAATLPDFSERLRLTPEDGEQTAAASAIVSGAFAVKLHELGWMCDAMPGKPIAFTRDGKRIEPFRLLDRLRGGELGADAWEAECREAGLERVSLV
jgi:Zn-dependent protease with chaperone function